MKALIINQFGGPEQLRIQETSIPSVRSGEVLVRIHAAGLNPVDYKIRNGSMKFISGKKFPRILGGDFAGTVEQADKKSKFRPGDKVYAMLSFKGGGYAEFVAVDEKQLCLIPENLDMTEAAGVPLASLTALQAFLKKGSNLTGDRVLINGASGGVGSFAVQIARAMGAYVTGVCSSRNTEFVKNLGADQVIDYTTDDFTKLKAEHQLIFDAVAKSSFPRCRKVLSKNGMYITTVPNNGLLMHKAFNFTRSKKANYIMVKPSGQDLMIISDYIRDELVRPYIEKEFPLEEGAKAHEMIETGRVRGKIVLRVI